MAGLHRASERQRPSAPYPGLKRNKDMGTPPQWIEPSVCVCVGEEGNNTQKIYAFLWAVAW